MEKKELDDAFFKILSLAGEAGSKALEALEAYQKGDYVQTDKCLKQADELSVEANKVLYSLVQKEAQGKKIPVSLLLIHVCDVFMASMIEKQLIKIISSKR